MQHSQAPYGAVLTDEKTCENAFFEAQVLKEEVKTMEYNCDLDVTFQLTVLSLLCF